MQDSLRRGTSENHHAKLPHGKKRAGSLQSRLDVENDLYLLENPGPGARGGRSPGALGTSGPGKSREVLKVQIVLPSGLPRRHTLKKRGDGE